MTATPNPASTMNIEILLLGCLLVGLAIYFLWAAYQIQVKNRIDLVQFGTAPPTRASLHKRQFAALHIFHGATCLVAGLLLLITENLSPGVWVFVGFSCALSVRRQLLISSIEKSTLKSANN